MKRCSPSDCSSPVGLGYTKINLPLLRRCISDPTHSPPDLNNNNFNSSSPSPTRSSLPPPSASLRRSVSDLNPSPASNNSPNSKRLKRMKGRLKEMSEWCMQLMQEEDEQEEEDDDDEEGRKNEGPTTPDVPEADANPNDTSTEGSSEKEFSESVSVEKKDDSLVIHFRCHCDKACQFLLNGTDCYYKVL